MDPPPGGAMDRPWLHFQFEKCLETNTRTTNYKALVSVYDVSSRQPILELSLDMKRKLFYEQIAINGLKKKRDERRCFIFFGLQEMEFERKVIFSEVKT